MKCQYKQDHKTCEHKSPAGFCWYYDHIHPKVPDHLCPTVICEDHYDWLATGDKSFCEQCGSYFIEGTSTCKSCSEMFAQEEADNTAIIMRG